MTMYTEVNKGRLLERKLMELRFSNFLDIGFLLISHAHCPFSSFKNHLSWLISLGVPMKLILTFHFQRMGRCE